MRFGCAHFAARFSSIILIAVAIAAATGSPLVGATSPDPASSSKPTGNGSATMPPSKSSGASSTASPVPPCSPGTGILVLWHMSGNATIGCATETQLASPEPIYSAAAGAPVPQPTYRSASVTADSSGNLVISFAACADSQAQQAFHGARRVNGIEFLQGLFTPSPAPTQSPSPQPSANPSPTPSPLPCTVAAANTGAGTGAANQAPVPEDRFIVLLENIGPAQTNRGNNLWMTIAVNPLGICYVDGQLVLDQEHAACSGSTKRAGASSDTCGDAMRQAFCGSVSIGFNFVRKALGLGPADRVHVVDAFTNQYTAIPKDSGPPQQLPIRQNDGDLVDAQEKPNRNWRGWQTFSQLNQKSPSGSPSPASSAGPSSDIGLSGAAVYPINDKARISAGVQTIDLSFIDKRYRQLLLSVAGQTGNSSGGSFEKDSYGYNAATPKPSASPGALPDAWIQDQFDKIDVDPFETVVQEPIRYGETLPFADRSTALQPLNFKAIPKYNYGAKIVSVSDYARYGAAYYRNYYGGELRSGTALHAELVRQQDTHPLPDQTLGILNKNTLLINLGTTYVVANRGSDSYSDDSNAYVTRLHSSNLAIESAVGFGDRFRYKAFFHDAFVDTGNDAMFILSTGTPTAGNPYRDDGSALRFHASAGYRAVDVGYDPLGTIYDEFTGTKTLFASGGFNWNSYPLSIQPSAEISVARSIDSNGPEYSLVNATLGTTIPNAKKKNGQEKIDVTYQRSGISALMFSKEAGKYNLVGQSGAAAILPNDVWKADLSYDNSFSNGLTISAGPGASWATTPTSCTQTGCSPSYLRNLNFNFKLSYLTLLATFSAAPASTQNGTASAPGGSSGSASNQTHYSALLNYCHPVGKVHLQPRIAYDSNISDGISSYIPGTLVEPGLDILSPTARQFGLRIGWKIVHESPAFSNSLQTSQQYSGLEFKLININTTNTGSADSCNPSSDGSKS